MRYLISVSVLLITGIFVLLMLPVSFILWFIVWPFDNNRVIFHWWLTVQSIAVTWLMPAGTLKIEGCDKITRGQTYIIISNHQSVLDILILYRLRMNFKWISKIENIRVPVFGWYLKMAGYIPVDRGNKESKAEMMKKSVEVIKRGISIMIFPEGTRSVNGETGLFKKGAFELALMTDKPILPVVLDGTGGMLPKQSRLIKPVSHVIVKVLDPVFPGAFGTSDPEELAAKFRKIIETELIQIRSAIP